MSELARSECKGGFLEEVVSDYDTELEDNELRMLHRMSFQNLLCRAVMNSVGQEFYSAPNESDNEPDAASLSQNHISTCPRFRDLGDYVFSS